MDNKPAIDATADANSKYRWCHCFLSVHRILFYVKEELVANAILLNKPNQVIELNMLKFGLMKNIISAYLWTLHIYSAIKDKSLSICN